MIQRGPAYSHWRSAVNNLGSTYQTSRSLASYCHAENRSENRAVKERGPSSLCFLHLEICKTALCTAPIRCSTPMSLDVGFCFSFKANIKTYASSYDTSMQLKELFVSIFLWDKSWKTEIQNHLGGLSLVPVLLCCWCSISCVTDWVGVRKISLENLADHYRIWDAVQRICALFLMRYWEEEKGAITDEDGGTVIQYESWWPQFSTLDPQSIRHLCGRRAPPKTKLKIKGWKGGK